MCLMELANRVLQIATNLNKCFCSFVFYFLTAELQYCSITFKRKIFLWAIFNTTLVQTCFLVCAICPIIF